MATLLPNDDVSAAQLHGYRIFIYSHDHPHPPHVHVRRGRQVSSWDLATLECVAEDGFSSSDIRLQRTILTEHRDAVLRSWNAHWQRHRSNP
jgi:hypothetical protein